MTPDLLPDHLADRITVDPDTKCWIWRGSHTAAGYARIKISGREHYVHRLTYAHYRGPIDDSIVVRHRCPAMRTDCVCPDHLRSGTHRDNARDRLADGTQPRGAGHGRSKLTEDDVIQIRAEAAAGVTQIELSRMFRVSQPTISQIVRRVIWREVA